MDCLVRFSLRLVGWKPTPTCVIVYYHSIPDSLSAEFARQMDVVQKTTTPIALEPRPNLSRGERYLSVTFDDGFENVIQNALPELEKRNIPATIFVTVGRCGQIASWWPAHTGESGQRIASVEMLLGLPRTICIGSHALSHASLTDLKEDEARRELVDSRTELERLLARKVTTFSFPNGAFTEDMVDWCRDAGYRQVFTSLPRIAFQEKDEYVTGRVSVDPSDWPLEFRLKIAGAYRWLPYAIRNKRKIVGSPRIPVREHR